MLETNIRTKREGESPQKVQEIREDLDADRTMNQEVFI